MPDLAIVYGTSTGRTEEVAKEIKKALGCGDLFNVADISSDTIKDYQYLILGTPTWGTGDLQDDWIEKKQEWASFDFQGKEGAFFGLGDQESFPETFVDGMGELYQTFSATGLKVVGSWTTDGYFFGSSKALVKGVLVGLALDEDNQARLTPERIKVWVQGLKRAWKL